ncbi:MAG: DNA repair exonuclease [Coriobacteriia bacterium]|nr:DNA repair exonuclease [Coriobacteriia bacterium]
MRERVTFVHAADLHLDAPFVGIATDDERVGNALAEATYAAFEAIVDLAVDRAVDFVVIAGDAYNSADKSVRAQRRFREQVRRLDAAGISTFVVHGNHDPLSGFSAGMDLPASVHVFPAGSVGRVEAVRDGEFVCAVYGRSFGKAAETEDFAAGYRREADDAVAVGVLHANVGGNPDYDAYAPCSLDDLRAGGMDYWALGHVHKHEVLSKDPWVVYAGSPQGLNPKETGTHGCCLVEVQRGGAVSLEHIDLAPVSWAVSTLDASAAEDVDDVEQLVGRGCEEVRGSEARPTVVRLALVGRSDAHPMLARPGAVTDLHEAVRREQAAREPWLWIDRLDDRTAAPLDLDTLRAGEDFAAEVVAVADDLAAGTAGELDAMVADIGAPVADKLRGFEPTLPADELLALARDRCLDALLSGGDAR